jgi:hypothetical protein
MALPSQILYLSVQHINYQTYAADLKVTLNILNCDQIYFCT